MAANTELEIGTYVNYVPYKDCDVNLYQKGRIKSFSSNINYCFVVFKCHNNCDDYENYTSERVHISDLIVIE